MEKKNMQYLFVSGIVILLLAAAVGYGQYTYDNNGGFVDTVNTTVPASAADNSQAAVQDTGQAYSCSDLSNMMNGTSWNQRGDVCDIVFVKGSGLGADSGMAGRANTILENTLVEVSPVPAGRFGDMMAVGRFALEDRDMNNVISAIVPYGWNITSINAMPTGEPVFLQWEAAGTADTLIAQIQKAMAQASMMASPETGNPVMGNINISGEGIVVNSDNVNSTSANASTGSMMVAANLTGGSEVPPVDTPATGTVTGTLDGNMLSISGDFTGLQSDLMDLAGSSSHIHNGVVGEEGPIVLNVNIVPNDDNRSGTLNLIAQLDDSQVASLRNGDYYINVHTLDNPNGEIRGQLMVQ